MDNEQILDFISNKFPNIVTDIVKDIDGRDYTLFVNGIQYPIEQLIIAVVDNDFKDVQLKIGKSQSYTIATSSSFIYACTDFPDDEVVYQSLKWLARLYNILSQFIEYTKG